MVQLSVREIASALNAIGYSVVKAGDMDADGLHFLHIGKCAGTQIAEISRDLNKDYASPRIIIHGHDVPLRDIPKQSRYFFSIRNPLSRFKSAFYSRKRKGRPRYNVEWTRRERAAFEEFPHATDLAESLFEEGSRGSAAWAAMKSISHTAQNQSDWFCQCGNFLDARPPVWIIRQERFDEDLIRFIAKAGFTLSDEVLQGFVGRTKAHANDYGDAPQLTERAIAKLNLLYSQDFELYRACVDWINKNS